MHTWTHECTLVHTRKRCMHVRAYVLSHRVANRALKVTLNYGEVQVIAPRREATMVGHLFTCCFTPVFGCPQCSDHGRATRMVIVA